MRHTRYLPIALALGLTTASALAAPPAGQLLASQCAQCHGTNGYGPGFDKLAGMSARELSSEMREMKTRTNAEGIMDRQAHGYTDTQIQLIATYLSGQRGTTSGTTSGTTTGTTTGGTSSGTSSGVKPVKTETRRHKFSRDHRD
jgi:cytochrome c553